MTSGVTLRTRSAKQGQPIRGSLLIEIICSSDTVRGRHILDDDDRALRQIFPDVASDQARPHVGDAACHRSHDHPHGFSAERNFLGDGE